MGKRSFNILLHSSPKVSVNSLPSNHKPSHPFIKYLPSAHSALGTILGTGDVAANRTEGVPSLTAYSVLEVDTLNRYVSKMILHSAKCPKIVKNGVVENDSSRQNATQDSWLQKAYLKG